MVELNGGRRGQTFSADILVVVVVVLFGALFMVVNNLSSTSSDLDSVDNLHAQAAEQAEIIVQSLRAKNIIDSENQVDVERLLSLDEEQIRSELNLRGDFGIVFEKDGKLVKIDPSGDINCVGSKSIIVNGKPCK